MTMKRKWCDNENSIDPSIDISNPSDDDREPSDIQSAMMTCSIDDDIRWQRIIVNQNIVPINIGNDER